MKKYICIALALMTTACGPLPKPVPPAPPAPPAATWLVDAVACADAGPVPFACRTPIAGATIQMHGPDGYIRTSGDGAGYAVFTLPAGFADSDVNISAAGYVPIVGQHVDVAGTHDSPRHNIITLQPDVPAPPTRAQALNVHLTFQGLIVQTQQFGALPWFEAALPWLNAADRAAVYAAKHASQAWPGGDTHCIVFLPHGPPLYDEANQPYSADRFPAMDWTAGNTRIDLQYIDLIVEVRRNGFIPLLFLGGDGPNNYPDAMAELPLVMSALQQARPRDLRYDVVVLPGWDSVFYGWEPSHDKIPAFGALFRSLCADCYLGIEHGTGHIPLGEGDGDWVRGGDMQAFDLLLDEFDDERWDDSVWQIAARLLGPAYTRDPQQPADDDPGAPFGQDSGKFYFRQGTNRGPLVACAFEFYEYTFVRGALPANVARSRDRLRARGYTCGG